MQNLDWDQIRATLPSARNRGLLSKRDHSVQSRDQAILLRRYSEQLSSGLAVQDRGKLNQTRQQYQAELRRLQEAAKNGAIERSQTELATLRSTIDTWRETTENMVLTRGQRDESSSPDINFNFVVLDEPGLILPLDDASVLSSIAPGNNVARMSTVWGSSPFTGFRYAGVEFVFAWRNPSSTAVTINVESVLELNGFGLAWAEGGFNATNHTYLDADMQLQLYVDLSPLPIYIPPEQSGQSATAARLDAYGGGLFGLGELQSQAITGNYDMIYRTMLVPGGDVAIFLVTLSCGLTAIDGGGYGEVDFASGHFEIMCPELLIAIL